MTDEATTPSKAAPVSLPEIAQQIAAFEDRVAQSLSALAQKLDGLESPARAEADAAPVIAAEAMMPLPPVAEPDAHAGEASGLLGGLAHKVADFAKGAVGGLRSDDVDALGNPDGGITPAQAAEASAVHTPIGSHTLAVEERRAHTAPALAVAG
jgi:hypothetical protein